MKKVSTLILTLATTVLISQTYAIKSIADSLRNNADAIIRNESTEIFLSDKESIDIYYKTEVTVFNKKGEREGFPMVHYNNATKVVDFNVSIYNQYGALIKEIKNKDIEDESAVSSSQLYSDNRVKYYRYIPTQYPYTVSYQYHIKSKNTLLLRDWYIQSSFNVSVEKSTYTLHNPRQLQINYKERNLKDIPIDKTITETQLSFSLKKPLKALEYEPFAPSARNLVPMVQIAPNEFHHENTYGKTNTWQNFGNWIHSLVEEHNDLSETAKLKARKLTEGLSKKEKVKKLYEYMQNKTRYIYVGIGIGGLQPYPASDVDRLGYGDCKGLTNYMKNLLDAVDIPSYYTVIYGNSDHKINFNDDFTDFQGNHVILCVPLENNDTIWLENTSQKLPFNFLGDFTFDRKALLVNGENSKIIQSQQFPEEKNTQTIKAQIHFVNETAKIKIERKSKNLEYSQLYFLKEETSEDQETFYKNHFDKIKNLKINSIHLENDKDNVTFTETLDFDYPNSINLNQNTLIFTPNVLIHQVKLKKDSTRKFPVEIDWGFVNTAEFEIQLPNGYTLENLPEKQSFKSDFGAYSLTFEKVENRIILKRYLKLFENIYPPEKYNDFVSFTKKIRKADKIALILNKIN